MSTAVSGIMADNDPGVVAPRSSLSSAASENDALTTFIHFKERES